MPQHAEDLRPALKRDSTGNRATLEFTAFSRSFRVQLTPNERLARVAAGTSMQLYRGTLEGTPGSWARISIRDGLPRGLIWDGRDLYVVEAGAEGVNYGAAGTVLFRLSDAVLQQGVSFAGDAVEKPRDAGAAYEGLVDELRANTRALQAGVAVDGVNVSILGDASYLARYPTEAQAREAILTRLNNVDGIFSTQLGVALEVATVDLSGDITSNLSATTDSSALLDGLGRLRERSATLSATGLTHLITGRALDGNSAGVAYTLSLCSPRFAASLSMAHNSTVLDSLIIAHEIGHVFGAPHDGVQQCEATPQGQFIMTPTIDSTITSFSQCSVDQISSVIDSYSCVRTLPDPEPVPPAPPAPAPPAPPSGDDGGGGGSGALDLMLLLSLLAVLTARVRASRLR